MPKLLLSLFLFFNLATIATANVFKYKIQHQEKVHHLIGEINRSFLWNSLVSLTQFPDRSSETNNGLAAARWLKSQVDLLIKIAKRDDALFFEVETKTLDEKRKLIYFKQPSLILKIGKSTEPGVLVGAHFDTYPKYTLEKSKKICAKYTNQKSQKLCQNVLISNKPGADDDGSGTAANLEIARLFLNSKERFHKPIYLAWYAAEENGSIGSKAVVEYFDSHNIKIAQVMQLDQIGFAKRNHLTMWLITNFVDKELTQFAVTLIQTYIRQPVFFTQSKEPASDNFSWFEKKIPVIFPFESEMKLGRDNVFVHSEKDSLETISITHLLNYTKLAVAFIAELAEPIDR